MATSVVESMQRIAERFHELGERLSSQDVLSDPSKITKIARERAELEPKVHAFERFQSLTGRFAEARTILEEESDEELAELAHAEIDILEPEIGALEEQLKLMLLPKDPLDGKDIVMEIRAGTGGEEAALFASELYRMYAHYADRRGWKTEVLSTSPSETGGFKEIIIAITGTDVSSHLKFESGVHRVQRVPVTESQGRIHTSAASVVVMPEAEDITVAIDPGDLKIDVFRSSGPGGQSVNTTDSAVRVTHLPSGLVVSCQDEKSQLKNKQKALKVLRARLTDRARAEQDGARGQARKSMIGSGDRSQKIRTYNFPQSRVTDHRINLTLHNLEGILAGDLDDLVAALRLAEQQFLLENRPEELASRPK